MLKMAETPSASLKRAARARDSTAREQVARVSESMNIPEKQNEPHAASTCGKRVANREEELKSQAAPEQQRSAKRPFPSFTPASCLPSPISSTLASSSSSTLASSSSTLASSSSSSPSSTLASSSSSTLASSSSSTLASSSSSSSGAEGRATLPPPFTHERAGSLLVISLRQKGNPLLKFITAVPHTFAYIAPDFLVGPSACVLFLSLRYHQLFPSYLSKRIEDLADGRYTHKFLLLHVDLEVPDAALAQVTLLAFHHCFSLLLGTCLQECAGVLQLLKAYEKKPADTLLAKLDAKHCNRVLETLTAISPLNKTDVLTLASAFGNVKNILLASRQALERCPGIGEKKARRILKVVRQPFFSPLSSASASAHFATSASSSPPSSSDSSLSSAPALPPPLSSPLCIRDDAS
ncbi:DNA repair protein rad10 subfamily protein [Toxoplasma gondii VAND]|uniref:DNA repair protein rad10 subfamily protein n=1 Tax=Toxoplasma gondii VAND TaxID=933077 RepID=A0A086QHE3_TOXGO|nr:DNA repair protein rad10 subfamily protein [Toxoplasma gondii VAND]